MRMIKRRALLACLLCISGGMHAQTHDLDWDISMYSIGATEKSLPFWAVTNRNGAVPDSPCGFMSANADYSYGTRRGIRLYAGLRITASIIPVQFRQVYTAPMMEGWPGYRPESTAVSRYGSSTFHGRINRLYLGIGWKKLRFDLGTKDRVPEYNGLSVSGGNIAWSGNTRAIPGYNLSLDWCEIPGTKGIWSVKAHFGDYITRDRRFVDKARLHNKAIEFRFRLHPKLFLNLGLEHFCLWGGTSPVYGIQPHSFIDYLRIFCGLKSGPDASESDQINALGDHRGREIISLDWQDESFSVKVAHDIPFDDGSGMGLQNFPDGVNTVHFSFRDKDKWVSDILYEFVYTKCQSGNKHERPASEEELEQHPDRPVIIMGGNDNYFNNGEYRTGWTYHGKTIGLPLFTPTPINDKGLVYGVVNNRVIAHHLGLAGKLAHLIRYRFLATYSRNYGKYSQSMDVFKSAPYQVSLGLELESPTISRAFPVNVGIGLYGDVGDLYTDNFGVTIRLTWNGRFSKNGGKGRQFDEGHDTF